MVSAAPADSRQQQSRNLGQCVGCGGARARTGDTHLELGITYLRPAPPASHPIISDVFLPGSGEVTSAPRTDPGVTSTRVS